jgi:HAD superfamily hydrolase (TIGR01484 family)
MPPRGIHTPRLLADSRGTWVAAPGDMDSRGPRSRAIAIDYDGTLAEHGRVPEYAVAALHRAKRAGKKLVLVTGRELDDLLDVFPAADVFDAVVAENGAVLYAPLPLPPRERALASPPPLSFIETLAARGVRPLAQARVMVATRQPHEETVLETIEEMGLPLEVVFDRDIVMVLPTGVHKGSGLRAALAEIDVDAPDVVGVGDAENDHALLEVCGIGVAVANAVPALKLRADVVVPSPSSQGVVEAIELLERSERHRGSASFSFKHLR